MNGDCHEYMVHRARALFDMAHVPTFANMVASYETALVEGARFADRAGPPLEIIVTHRVLGCGVAESRFEICNFASLNHYYDPWTDRGLDLSGWGDIEALIEVFAFFLFAGIYFPDLSVEPRLDFNTPYPSAAEECQRHYDLAISKWAQGDCHGAFFELGWACHFVADACTSPHTVSDEFVGHGEYEDWADTRFGHPPYMASGVGPYPAAWHQQLTPYQLIAHAARETRSELHFYQAGEGSWDQGVQHALPRAEFLTACLIARFMEAIHVNTTCPPISVTVTNDHTDIGIDGAFVYHREAGKPGWQRVQTDANGRCTLQLKENKRYELRPALPGYAFLGAHGADQINGIAEFSPNVSPVSFVVRTPSMGGMSLNLKMKQVAMQMITLALPSTVTMATPLIEPVLTHPSLRTLPDHIDRKAKQLVVNIEAEDTGRGEEIGVVRNDPQGKRIAVRVSDILDLQTLQLAASVAARRQPFDRVADRNRIAALHASTHPHAHAQPPMLPPQVVAAFQPIIARSEKYTRRDTAGNAVRVSRLSHARLTDTEFLGRSGLVLVPADSQYEVELSVISGQGLVGYGLAQVPPVTRKTDPSGVAVFTVKGGDQVGELRLRFTVRAVGSGAAAGHVEATREVSVWVWPDAVGTADASTQASPPSIA